MADPSPGPPPPSAAEALFGAWLLGGGRADFEASRLEHPDHAGSLRRLHAARRRSRTSAEAEGPERPGDPARSSAQRLGERFGSGVDTGMSFDAVKRETADLSTSARFRRLVRRTLDDPRRRIPGRVASAGERALVRG